MKLDGPDEQMDSELLPPVVLKNPVCTVTIIDDDEPGKLEFKEQELHINEGADESVELVVQRRAGSSGIVSCQYRTVEGTAKAGLDYEETSGTLTFLNGECEKAIVVPIIDDEKYEKKEHFRVICE